jgi:hypothetical protein
MTSFKNMTVQLPGALFGGMLLATTALAGGPVGELEVRGHVQIGQASGDQTVSVRDTSYGWFSGDRIVTRSGHGVLSLDSGATFGFGEDTEAVLDVDDGEVRVDLRSGVLLYAIDADTTEMQVSSGEYRFSTRSGEARPVQVADGSDAAAGMISVLEDGQVRVSVRDGLLVAGDGTGALRYQVETGEAVEFSGTEVRQVQVQVEAARGDDDDAGGWIRNNPAVAGLVIAAGAYVGYRVFFRSDDDDPDPVSP